MVFAKSTLGKMLGPLCATLIVLPLLASTASAQNACWTCPYKEGVGGYCYLGFSDGSCSCYEEGTPPHQGCGTAGTCLEGDDQSCGGSTGGGGGGCCMCNDGSCALDCCTDVKRGVNTKLDAEFDRVRQDWSKADGVIRLHIRKSCAEGEIGRRYRALADELNTKLIIFTTDRQEFKAADWDKVEIAPSTGERNASDDAEFQKIREDWEKTDGPIRLHLTKKVADGEIGRRYKALAKELRKSLTIFVIEEEDIRVTPEDKKALGHALQPQQ
jgi:hypothetical protein